MLRTLVFKEKQVATRDGRWFSVRIMPYRTLDNRIDGVVITFVDITAAKTLEATLRQTRSATEKRAKKGRHEERQERRQRTPPSCAAGRKRGCERPAAKARHRRGHEADTQRLVHELQVHQIELEMQNEELRRARAELEAGLERYTDLYDFAPVGYLTLDRDGAIRQVNLTGARLLGLERARLVGRRFGVFVGEPDRAGFNTFLERVFESQAQEVCEVALLNKEKGRSGCTSRLWPPRMGRNAAS